MSPGLGLADLGEGRRVGRRQRPTPVPGPALGVSPLGFGHTCHLALPSAYCEDRALWAPGSLSLAHPLLLPASPLWLQGHPRGNDFCRLPDGGLADALCLALRIAGGHWAEPGAPDARPWAVPPAPRASGWVLSLQGDLQPVPNSGKKRTQLSQWALNPRGGRLSVRSAPGQAFLH